MHSRLSVLPLIIVLGLAGCGQKEPVVEAGGFDLNQSMSLLTFYGEDEVPFLHLAYDPDHSFHFAPASAWMPVGDPSELTSQQPVGLEGPFREGRSSGRFSGSAVRVSGFRGAVANAAFSGRSPGAGGFDGSAVDAPGFSGSLSTGRVGGCSLRGICDFVGLICDATASSSEERAECAFGVRECRATIDSAPVPPELSPILCAFSDYIDCLLFEVRGRGLAGLETLNPESICRAEALALVQAGIDLDFSDPDF